MLTEAVLNTTISSVSLILVAVVTGVLANVRKDMKSVRGQVENDHTTNLREEQDERHDYVTTMLVNVVRDVGGMREDFRHLRGEVVKLRDDLNELEDTVENTEGKGGKH